MTKPAEGKMKTLKLADDLELPIDAVTQTFALLGRRGSGKTYGSGKLAELFLDAGAQIVVLDPIGVWYGLRLSADGQHKGFSIPVFGGEHGDIPLEPQAGALIAKLLVEERFSAVLDVSTFRKEQRKQFVTDFAEELMHRKKTSRSAMHVFFEESQLFVPQHVSGKEARMVGAFEDLIKLGRNYGIGASLISQRPQSVNKDVLNQTEVLLAFQMTGPQERKTIDGWISDKGIDEKLSDVLPSLKVGYARLWSPQWLGVSKTIHIAKKKTFDASSTPTVGAAIVQPKDLSPVDVEKISVAMSDVVKRAEESDPKKLKLQVSQLQAQIKKLESQPVPQATVKETVKEIPVLKDSQISIANATIEAIDQQLTRINEQIDKLREIRDTFVAGVNQVASARKQTIAPPAKPIIHVPSRSRVPLPSRPVAVMDGDLRLNGTQQRILDAIAWWESIGIPSPSTIQIGAVALVDPTGGHFSNLTGPLSSNGLIERSAGHIQLTEAGRAIASVPETAATLSGFHDVLRSRVRKMKQASGRTIDILDTIIAAGGRALSPQEIGEAVGIDHTGGHFSNTIGPLSTAGLIQRSSGLVTPTDILFPPGLS
jgi:hypothetical protein